MDWELFNNERNFALKMINLEIKNFNERIKRQKTDLKDEIMVSEWTSNEFIFCTEDIERILKQILLFEFTRKITKEEFYEIDDCKYEIVECKFYLGGELLTHYGIKNYKSIDKQ